MVEFAVASGTKTIMSDKSLCSLNVRKCPIELRKRLKKQAVDRDMDLQELIIEYLRSAVEKAEEGPKSNSPGLPSS
jgi:hypothetical protein